MKFLTPMSLAVMFIGLFWGFMFFLFSGLVQLADPVVAGLAGAAMSQSSQVILIVANHYYSRGRRDSDSVSTDKT